MGAKAALTLPPLQAWHAAEPWSEAFDYAGYESFAAYQADEQRFIAQVFQTLSEEEGVLTKYTQGSPYAPGAAHGLNENGSFTMGPEDQALAGGILLVHGLTDSPYHMKALAELFRSHGYFVLSLRLPGHGTAPGALVDITHQQWRTAVDFGVRIVLQEIESAENARFYVGGFSTGGALLLSYTFDALASETMRVPDHLFLFSPAIGITRRAVLADWHDLADWLPYYDKFRWTTVAAEEDPYKYSSFPNNAADQVFELTLLNKLKAHRVSNDAAERAAMPPILAFQSMVDRTVVATDLIALFQHVATPESELVLFDINRAHEALVDPERADTLPTNGRPPSASISADSTPRRRTSTTSSRALWVMASTGSSFHKPRTGASRRPAGPRAGASGGCGTTPRRSAGSAPSAGCSKDLARRVFEDVHCEAMSRQRVADRFNVVAGTGKVVPACIVVLIVVGNYHQGMATAVKAPHGGLLEA